jgi:hypothetical protein
MNTWDEFFANYWEKRPTTIPSSMVVEALGTIEETHNVIRHSYWRNMNKTYGDKPRWFTADREIRIVDPSLLPQPLNTCEEYLQLLARNLNSQDVAVIVGNAHRMSRSIFAQASRFISRVLYKMGPPAHSIGTSIYYGNYLESPAGLHKDGASTFNYVVHGTKRIYTWKFETLLPLASAAKWNEPFSIRSTNIPDGLGTTASVVSATAGQILYLPANGWHYAVGDGSACVTMNVSYFHSSLTGKRHDTSEDGLIEISQGVNSEKKELGSQALPEAYSPVLELRLESAGYFRLPLLWTNEHQVVEMDATLVPTSPLYPRIGAVEDAWYLFVNGCELECKSQTMARELAATLADKRSFRVQDLLSLQCPFLSIDRRLEICNWLVRVGACAFLN